VSNAAIRVELLGGLGNQMFQAAAGMAIAERSAAPLELDVTRILKSGKRQFGLGRLPIDARIVQDERGRLAKTMERTRFELAKRTQGTVHRPPNGWQGPVFVEPHFHYAKEVTEITAPCYLRGYFQSPKYFAECEERVRRAFDWSGYVSPDARSFADDVADADVAIHVRRGDYASNPKAEMVHGLLGSDYYKAALDILVQMSPIARVHLFSDDPSYARALLGDDPRVQETFGTSEYDDMFMMSKVRRHVIANSTFSWWSAWLDQRSDSVVVAPRAWFSQETMKNTDVRDLFPQSWIMI